MPTGRIIYWDSCVFLAWLKNEVRKPGIIEGIEQTVRLIDENKIVLVTSAISVIEVLDVDGVAEKIGAGFTALFDKPNVIEISVDPVISRLAADIRSHYKQQGKKIGVPDAIHLASAITYSAAELQTLDDQLLALNGNLPGHPLLICVPYATELNLLNKHEEE